jgi:hypothetical protein
MTPPAAARSTRSPASGSRSAVRHPRRISGPARVARSATAAAVAIPAPGIALPHERPLRPVVQPRRRPARKPARRSVREASPGIALRAAGTLEGISGSALFDRLIRGRLWIGLLAFALIGMVAMQLLVLKLNTGIGHTLERVAQLQRANAQLGIENSTSSAESRIAPSAATAGMTLAPVGTVHFVAASRANVSRAASVLAAPIQASASTQSTEASSGASEPSATEAGETATSAAPSSSSTAVGGETKGSPESSSAGSGSPQGSGATAETGASAESSSSNSGPQG